MTSALTRPADLSANRRSVNTSSPDLTGRLVRTVSWQGGRKLVSEPMLVVQHATTLRYFGRRTVVLKRPGGQVLQAYEGECELVDEEAVA